MSTVDKLLEVRLVARAVSQNFLYRRAASKLIVVVISAVITGMLTGTLLIAGLYVSYLILLDGGIGTKAATFIVGFVASIVTIAFGVMTVYFVGKLREALVPQLELMKHSLQHFTLF